MAPSTEPYLFSATGLQEMTPERLGREFDTAPAVVYVKTREGQYVFVNQMYEKLTGRSRQQVVGKNDFSIFRKEEATKFQRHDARVIAEKRALSFIEYVTLPNTGKRTFMEVKVPLFDSSGEVYAICAVAAELAT